MDLLELYDKLELTEDKGCLIRMSDNDWEKKVNFPSRISRLLKKNELLKTLDAFFCFDNKPLILFFDNPTNEKALHQAIWNFNESPIVFIVKNNEIEIYNGFAIDENKERLKRLGDDKLLTDFSYFELVTGKTWEKYKKEIDHKNRVDYRLLENIETAQKLLKEQGITQTTANALLGKIIFLRYLIDRNVKLSNGKKYICSNEDLCDCLKNVDEFKAFIQYIEDRETGFNGDMFRIDKSEFESITQDSLDILIRLLHSENIKTGQLSLFNMYDFSILPIEFISNVYEKFIGIEKQDQESAYYTPIFLVDYIVQETIGKKLNSSDDVYSCKVLDPACGSGIFLVETLRRIIEKYIKVKHIENSNDNELIDALNELVKENIFGIDKDFNAIQVAIFSVYLTLLDYQTPTNIENFKFPKLLGTNFIVADFFDLENDDLKKIRGTINFDCIIGNPPWMRGRVEYDLNGDRVKFHYEKYLSKTKQTNIVGNKELAQAFILRSLDFSNSNTKFSFVLTSKILYNLQSKKFRQFILNEMCIEQVFELASVRRDVFQSQKATTPACVLIYTKANDQNTDEHNVLHISLKPSKFFKLFKVFSLSRNDIQTISQKMLKENDWLWKTLVYGSYLDFNFIKRLKSMKSISSVLKDEKALVKQGLKRKDGNKIIDVNTLCGWDFLDLTKDIKQFFITRTHEKWNSPYVGYIYRCKDNKEIETSIYTAPMLLVKECVNTRLESVSAVSEQNLLFTDKVTSIKLSDDTNKDLYYAICGSINSSLFAYYVMQSSSTAGIMIEQQINDEERFGFPFLFSETLVDDVKKIECQNGIIYSSCLIQNNDISKLKENIDLHICKLLKMSSVEVDLWNYTKDVIIPLVMERSTNMQEAIAIKDKENILRDYASVYLNRFANSFNRNGKRFIVEILHSNQIIGMFFKIVDECDFKEEIVFSPSNDVLLSAMARLSSERITDNLFVQKDIRGFESDCFYIFKPNEKRLWHKAIAHLDVNEFAEAMLRVGGADNE